MLEHRNEGRRKKAKMSEGRARKAMRVMLRIERQFTGRP